MKISDSVRQAINDWQSGELDSAMLHACNAIDGTAFRVFPTETGSNLRFTRLLRDNYTLFGPMGVPGIDLVNTRFPVRVARPKAEGGQPDIADVIYGIHRCSHGHGQALPDGFELLRDAAGPDRFTRLEIEKGRLRLSDRAIFGLLAVAVMVPVNGDQMIVPDGYFLSFDGRPYLINDWWGRAKDFLGELARNPLPSVKLDFGDWMGSP